VKDPAAGRRLRAFTIQRWPDSADNVQRLADAMGVSKSAVHAWFNGQEPTMGSLRRLADVLGVKRWELVRVFDGE